MPSNGMSSERVDELIAQGIALVEKHRREGTLLPPGAPDTSGHLHGDAEIAEMAEFEPDEWRAKVARREKAAKTA